MTSKSNNRLRQILRTCERFTKTDMVYLLMGASWLSFTQLFASIMSFVTVYVLAETLTSEKLGEYRFLITAFTLVCVISLPGMRTALRESVPKGYTGNLNIAFWAMFRWGLLGSMIASLIAGHYLITGNQELSIGFVIIALVAPLYNAATGYGEYLIATNNLKLHTIYTSITRIITLIFILVAAALYPSYAWIILAATTIGTIIPNIIFHKKTLKLCTDGINRKDPNLIIYAKHLSIMTAFGLVAGQLDKLFIWNILGSEYLAVYYIAQTVPQNITSNLNTIPTLAFSKFSKRDPKLIRETLFRKILIYTLSIFVISATYCILSPIIFDIFFPKYQDAIIYSIAFAFIPVFGGFLPIKTFLTTTKATQHLYIISIIPPLTRIIVAILTIPSQGLWGVVWSMYSEAITRTVLLVVFFYRPQLTE